MYDFYHRFIQFRQENDKKLFISFLLPDVTQLHISLV